VCDKARGVVGRSSQRRCFIERPLNPGLFVRVVAGALALCGPTSKFLVEDGPKVSDCNDRNGLSRKCGNIGPLKRNGYFERFPHRRKDFKAYNGMVPGSNPARDSTLGRPLVSSGFAGCQGAGFPRQSHARQAGAAGESFKLGRAA
jgi:hypothetical protein